MSCRSSSCNWVVAALALWSMVSLVVVVVWASWPPHVGLEGCQSELQALPEKMEAERVMREKKFQALKREMEQSRETQRRLQLEIQLIQQSLTLTNASLTDALLEQSMLKENLTSLENEVTVSKSEQARLSQEQALNEAQIYTLQVNFTREGHQLDSCLALCDAARSQRGAAESKRKACESQSQYLLKHLQSCELQE